VRFCMGIESALGLKKIVLFLVCRDAQRLLRQTSRHKHCKNARPGAHLYDSDLLKYARPNLENTFSRYGVVAMKSNGPVSGAAAQKKRASLYGS
jgi:hypothetical protein